VVVGAQGRLDVGNEACVLAHEEVELAFDQVCETPGHVPMLPPP
jgi:hypothetical protein